MATEIPKPEDGGLTYTLKLRHGIKFHDGTTLDAEAVKFNFDRWRDTKNEYHKGGGGQTSEFAYYSAQFGGFDDDSVIESVEAVDETTVRFRLKEPQGPFLRNLTMSPFAIASPKAIKKDVEGFWQNPVGSGPYTFESWERNSQVRVEAFKDWWGADLPASEGFGGPKMKTVIIRSIPGQYLAGRGAHRQPAQRGRRPRPRRRAGHRGAGRVQAGVQAAEHHRLPGDEQPE